jgi:hypothetical protein
LLENIVFSQCYLGPLLYHTQTSQCDGFYNCMDRSDEDNCKQVTIKLVKGGQDVKCLNVLFKLRGKKSQTDGNKQYVTKLLPEHQRFERCNLTSNETNEDRGFRIGLECFPANKLCSGSVFRGYLVSELEENITMSKKKIYELIFHPQHLSICQNLTFWKEQRRQSRNHISCSTETTISKIVCTSCFPINLQIVGSVFVAV